jgi:hypothetical protein
MKKLDEKHELIKKQVKAIHELIKASEDLLEEVKKNCDHPEREFVNYMWAPGHIILNTEMCLVCRKIFKRKIEEGTWTITSGTYESEPTPDKPRYDEYYNKHGRAT